jgi:hypothetical protein
MKVVQVRFLGRSRTAAWLQMRNMGSMIFFVRKSQRKTRAVRPAATGRLARLGMAPGFTKFDVEKFDGTGNFGLWPTRVKDLLAQ